MTIATQRKLGLLLGLVLLALAWWLASMGLERLGEARQWQRLNVTPAPALLEGPYRLQVNTRPAEARVIGPYSGEPALWVEYRRERRVRSGDSHRWRTTHHGIRSVAALPVEDAISGAGLQLLPGGASRDNASGEVRGELPGIWQVPQSHYERSGDIRTREWAIPADSSMALELVAEYRGDGRVLPHARDRHGIPGAVTAAGALEQASGERGLDGVLLLGGGVLAVALGAGLVLVGLGAHVFWLYASVLMVLVSGQLLLMGVNDMRQEWQGAAELMERRLTAWQALPDSTEREAALLDLYALGEQVEASAGGWLDRAMARRVVEAPLSVLPPLPEGTTLPESTAVGAPQGFSQWMWVAMLALGGLGVVVLWLGLKGIRIKRLIDNLPLNRSGRVSYGLVKKVGRIESAEETTLTTPCTGVEGVVAYRYVVQRYKGGKNSSWETVSERMALPPARIVGEAVEGEFPEQTPLVLRGANIQFPHQRRKEVRENGQRYRHIERWLQQGDRVLVVGHAGLNPDAPDTLRIQSETGQPFIVAEPSEENLYLRRAGLGFSQIAGGLGLVLMALMGLLILGGTLTADHLVLLATLTPLLMLGCAAVLHYNDLIYLRHAVTRQRQHVWTQLQARADLWESLMGVARGYLAHERELMTRLVERRESDPDMASLPEQLKRDRDALAGLRARAEAYPELRGNEVIGDLMRRMEATENYLAFLRDAYLASVERYNTRIASFPDLLLARPGGFKREAATLATV
jgi:hypothetical protein